MEKPTRNRSHALGLSLCVVLLIPACSPPPPGVADERGGLVPAERRMYGGDELQFGELTVPRGDGPHPVVVFIHGGCWLAANGLVAPHRALAQALAADGVAVWSLEYRRVGNAGGGWPGTFLDVAAGADHVRQFAAQHNLDLQRVIAMGHSAGGHLALWLGARPRISPESELFAKDPLRLAGVIALAPAPQLADLHAREVCDHVIDGLMGGSPREYPERYRNASPSELAPLGVPQTVITGRLDTYWGPVGRAYVDAARAAGDGGITHIEAPHSDHSEVINPQSSTWPLVRQAVQDMLESP